MQHLGQQFAQLPVHLWGFQELRGLGVGRHVLADKAYDSNALRAIIAGLGAEIVIPSNRSRKIAIPHDARTYKQRNRIERCFGRLKHFRRFATRYDRRTIHFAGFTNRDAATIWLL